jgi:HlyD family secretion protein
MIRLMKYPLFIIILFVCASCSKDDSYKISLTGTLETIEVTISSKVSGEVRYVAIDEGSKILLTDTLLIIDPSDYEIQYKQAAANTEVSEAQYLQLFRGTRKEDLAQAEEGLNQAQANLKNAEDDNSSN